MFARLPATTKPPLRVMSDAQHKANTLTASRRHKSVACVVRFSSLEEVQYFRSDQTVHETHDSLV